MTSCLYRSICKHFVQFDHLNNINSDIFDMCINYGDREFTYELLDQISKKYPKYKFRVVFGDGPIENFTVNEIDITIEDSLMYSFSGIN